MRVVGNNSFNTMNEVFEYNGCQAGAETYNYAGKNEEMTGR
jgi:hypothetical protein